MNTDKAFRKLSLLGGPEVHPHSSLSISLQCISPPLAGGSPLASAHPTNTPPLQPYLCNAVFVNHVTQSRRRRRGTRFGLVTLSRFLKYERKQGELRLTLSRLAAFDIGFSRKVRTYHVDTKQRLTQPSSERLQIIANKAVSTITGAVNASQTEEC